MISVNLLSTPPIQLDVFFANGPTKTLFTETRGTWGTVLLCRTGSKEHNIKLAQRAVELGLKWKTTNGLCKCHPVTEEILEIVAGATEEEIFATLGLEWIPPILREV